MFGNLSCRPTLPAGCLLQRVALKGKTREECNQLLQEHGFTKQLPLEERFPDEFPDYNKPERKATEEL